MIKNISKPPIILFFCFVTLIFTACSTKKSIISNPSKPSKNVNKGDIAERYSLMLQVSKNDIKNKKLYEFIDDWIGVPHKMGGMDKKGVDCSGFTTLLQKEIYTRSVSRTAKQMEEQVDQKSETDLKEGDLVFFDLSGQKFSHVGIYLQNNKFVHASTSKGVIISNLKDPWYYKYLSRAGSVK
ncbi:MAG: NlpC/P60 family protein [Daejeonella sp.]